jgi:hypothetical protein
MPVMVNVGSTSSMLSVECTSGMFSANVNDTALAAAVTGVDGEHRESDLSCRQGSSRR